MKGKKKWLIGVTALAAVAQVLVTAGVAPPVLSDALLVVADALAPAA